MELPASSTPTHLSMPPPGPPLRCDRAHDIKKVLTRVKSPMKLDRVPILAPDFAGATIRYNAYPRRVIPFAGRRLAEMKGS